VVKKQADAIIEMEKTVFPTTQGSAADSPEAQKLSGNLIGALRQRPENRGQFLEEMVAHWKETNPKYSQAIAELTKSIQVRDDANAAMAKVMVMEELPKAREAFVLTKGAYDKPTDKVTARTPTTLPAIPDGVKHNRLALAKWLFSPENPLTARV